MATMLYSCILCVLFSQHEAYKPKTVLVQIEQFVQQIHQCSPTLKTTDNMVLIKNGTLGDSILYIKVIYCACTYILTVCILWYVYALSVIQITCFGAHLVSQKISVVVKWQRAQCNWAGSCFLLCFHYISIHFHTGPIHSILTSLVLSVFFMFFSSQSSPHFGTWVAFRCILYFLRIQILQLFVHVCYLFEVYENQLDNDSGLASGRGPIRLA